MVPEIVFFPVGNGDMTLIKLNNSKRTTFLIDINIRDINATDEDILDVKKDLLDRIEKDKDGRPFVDVFLLTHPDQDHCRGLSEHFHLGPLDDYPKEKSEKIIINEIWSSPVVFRRASKNHTLCEDAKAFNTEAKRRVDIYRKNKVASSGDRILIIEEDENGKTDDIKDIVVKVNQTVNKFNGSTSDILSANILGPLPKEELDEEEERLSKNHSSIIMQFEFSVENNKKANLFLAGGDAEVAIWASLWEKHNKNTDILEYDLLLAPHHCSWHTLSYDSWSKSDNPKVDKNAKESLSQSRGGASIISSSKIIRDDDCDPPCWGAKREYERIIKPVKGDFVCLQNYYDENYKSLVVKLTKDGPQGPSKKGDSKTSAVVIAASTKEPFRHG